MNYKIIVVNLKYREDRKNNVIQIFNGKYDINFFEAVNGKEIDLSLEIKNIFSGNDFNSRKGFIGCALSHYNIWLELIEDKDNDYYIILEDDITICDNFEYYLNENIKHINKENSLDILFLGFLKHNNTKDYDIWHNSNIEFIKFSRDLYCIGGTHGYIISKNGAIKIINSIEMNGIKHGIDYFIKINDNILNMEMCKPSIIYAEWLNNNNIGTDTNIQNDFSYFNLNNIYDYHNFHFFKNLDQMDQDIEYLNESIDKLILRSNELDHRSNGFNTVGFIKSNINCNQLINSKWMKENHGIFVKVNRKYKINIINANYDILNSLKKMSNNLQWKNLIIDSDINSDLNISLNKNFIENENTMNLLEQSEDKELFSEDLSSNENTLFYGTIVEENTMNLLERSEDKELFSEEQRSKENTMNLLERSEDKEQSWNENTIYPNWNINIPENIDQKLLNNYLSIISSPNKDKIDRIEFLKYLNNEIILNNDNIELDVYGNINNYYHFKNNKGILNYNDKSNGLFPYKYVLIGNNIWEGILSECFCFYYGDLNINNVDQNCLIKINLNDFETSYNIIKNTILNNLWEEKINYIKKEKYRILHYYSFFPMIERKITMNYLKNDINLLKQTRIDKIKIVIFKDNCKEINYKIIPFILSIKELGFKVDFDISNYNNEDIDSYIIINDSYILNDSYINIINHILYLPDNYDLCYINNNSNNKIVNQVNSLYYEVKKYYFKWSGPYIISKNGINKVIDSIKDRIDSIEDILHFENNSKFFYNIDNFNFYTNKYKLFTLS
jgi:GR25 family glycosyltransferase involved in LPS biosynthesis